MEDLSSDDHEFDHYHHVSPLGLRRRRRRLEEGEEEGTLIPPSQRPQQGEEEQALSFDQRDTGDALMMDSPLVRRVRSLDASLSSRNQHEHTEVNGINDVEEDDDDDGDVSRLARMLSSGHDLQHVRAHQSQTWTTSTDGLLNHQRVLDTHQNNNGNQHGQAPTAGSAAGLQVAASSNFPISIGRYKITRSHVYCFVAAVLAGFAIITPANSNAHAVNSGNNTTLFVKLFPQSGSNQLMIAQSAWLGAQRLKEKETTGVATTATVTPPSLFQWMDAAFHKPDDSAASISTPAAATATTTHTSQQSSIWKRVVFGSNYGVAVPPSDDPGKFMQFVFPKISNSRKKTEHKTWKQRWIDPSILSYFNANIDRNDDTTTTPSQVGSALVNKLLQHTMRLLVVVHCLLAWTFVLHLMVASWFLPCRSDNEAAQVTTNARERIGGYLVFKLLLACAILIPAVSAILLGNADKNGNDNVRSWPDRLDWLYILAWYTCIACLRSWNTMSSAATGRLQHMQTQNHATADEPSTFWFRSTSSNSASSITTGVMGLLAWVLVCNAVAAATCIALVVPTRGWHMAIWLCGECLLLATDVPQQALQHARTVWELQQSQQISALEEAQLQLHSKSNHPAASDEDSNDENASSQERKRSIQEQSWKLDQRMEMLEVSYARRLQWLEAMVFGCQLIGHVFTVLHFLHIWSIHGVQWTLIDGVLALHIHAAITGALQQMAQWQHLRTMATAIQRIFPTATPTDLKEHVGDVCCICLGSMVAQGRIIKILPRCGHLVHATCLRQVVERAPSLEHSKCPLCRSQLHQPNPKQDVCTAAEDLAGGINNTTGNVINVTAVTATNTTGITTNMIANNHTDGNNGTTGSIPSIPNRGNATIATGTIDEDVRPVAGIVPRAPIDNNLALFRVSTEGVLPSWIPIPSLSFEVIRRPTPATAAAAAVPPQPENAGPIAPPPQQAQPPQPIQQQQRQPQVSFLRRLITLSTAPFLNTMTPEQEAIAMDQLVDMFPQHTRNDLLQALRRSGSSEAVAEAVLVGRIRPAAVGG